MAKLPKQSFTQAFCEQAGLMCRVLQVSKSGYYAWLKRKPSPRAQQNTELAVAIRVAHERNRETYGPLRL